MQKGSSSLSGSKEGISAEPLIVLERKVCFGACPAYSISIFGDGRTVYQGPRHVKITGKVELTLDRSKILELLASVAMMQYFDFRDSYVGPGDGCVDMYYDEPTAVITISDNSQRKTVVHYAGCMARKRKLARDLRRLTILENKIDSIVEVQRFIGNPAERKNITPRELYPVGVRP